MTARKRGLWESVYYAIVHSRTLTLTTSLYLPGERAHIDRILGAFLEAAGMEQLRNNLAYCVHELAGNAKKANMKRLYFKEKDLDILSKDDYARGMERFKTETIEQISHYLAGLKENGLYVKFQFRKLKKGVRVSVRNNSTPAPAEIRRIEEKIGIVRQYTCLADAYSRTQDGLEGAGLGIVMMLFMLKNLGFGPEAFSFRAADNETVATLTLAARTAAETEEEERIATA